MQCGQFGAPGKNAELCNISNKKALHKTKFAPILVQPDSVSRRSLPASHSVTELVAEKAYST